jgi:hypothetical protein
MWKEKRLCGYTHKKEGKMGLLKKILSKKGVEAEYWNIKEAHLLNDGTLNIFVRGYISAEAYASGLDPLDELNCVVTGADAALKSPFYIFLKAAFPMFDGAEDELSYSRANPAEPREVFTVQDPFGRVLSVWEPPEADHDSVEDGLAPLPQEAKPEPQDGPKADAEPAQTISGAENSGAAQTTTSN